MANDLSSPSLLGAQDPPPVVVHNPGGRCPALLICDHASNQVPSGLDLGVDAAGMARHVAYDIGAWWVTERLMERLDATVVVSGYSRLVMDLNRPIGDPASMPVVSDGTIVPGNRDLSPAELARRATALYQPYHAAVAAELARRSTDRLLAPLLSIHTCTPVMRGFVRPWQIGLAWDWDPRVPVPLLARLLRRGDICVGDNQPYTSRGMSGHTVDIHCTAVGRANVLVEVRQDLVADPAGARIWADVLADAFIEILKDPDVFVPRRYDPPLAA